MGDPGDAGRYLSSFTDAWMKSRGLEETIRRGDVYEADSLFRIRDYLDRLDRENQAQGTLETILKNQRGPQPGAGGPSPAVPPPPPGPPPSPPPGAPESAAPVAPAVAPPLAQGGLAALNQPPPALGQPPMRPSVQDTLLQGVSPAAQAQFLTTQTGRSTWPSIEAAERERRQAEDHAQAETFMTSATQAVQDNKPAEWADHMAAFYRRIGQHDKAARMMEYSARIRTDKQEAEQAPKDFEAIYGAIQAWQADPSPAKFAAVTKAMSEAPSMTARAFSLETMKNAISKKLAQDPDENALLQHVGLRMVRDKIPEEQAWSEAMEKFPSGMVKLWQRALIAPDKVHLPQSFWDVLRIAPPMVSKGNETLGQRAYQLAMKEATEQGFTNDPVRFTRRWNELENEMILARKKAEETPAKHEAATVDLELKQERLAMVKRKNELLKNPAAATVGELTLWIQRLNTDIASGNLGKDEEDEAIQTRKFFRDLLAQKRQELGGPGPKDKGAVGALPPAGKYKGKTIRNPETGTRYQSDGKKWVEIP